MKSPLLVIVPALAAASVALTGCSMITDALHHERSFQFDSASAMNSGWNRSAAWVPSDGTGIRIHDTNDGAIAILRVDSDAATLPSSCVQRDRRSGPAFDESWVPDAYVEKAWVCGDWDVIPTSHGYFGWTPITPGE